MLHSCQFTDNKMLLQLSVSILTFCSSSSARVRFNTDHMDTTSPKALFETTALAPDSAQGSLAPTVVLTFVRALHTCSGLHTVGLSLKPNPKPWIQKGPEMVPEDNPGVSHLKSSSQNTGGFVHVYTYYSNQTVFHVYTGNPRFEMSVILRQSYIHFCSLDRRR